MQFEGKVALVTGGASGIGQAAALAFAREGAAVVIGDTDARAAETAERIRAGGGHAEYIRTDVCSKAEVEQLVAGAVRRFGGLHVALNNAGILPPPRPFVDVAEQDFDRTLAVDLKGVFLCMQAELRHMLAHGGGAIVNTASVGAVIANPNMAPYVAAKHGVAGLTKAAAIEYARAGIRVNAIAPGLVRTAMTEAWFQDAAFIQAFYAASPIGRAADPAEMTGMILHLCSDAASFTNGQVFVIDGGQTAI
jgi:NAD(P)-dependent dehydrogenase (short-subunit alcohol dehydrogenase family)